MSQEALAWEYIEFMRVVGCCESEHDLNDLIKKRFSSNVVKIENHNPLLRGSYELSRQLHEAREWAFPWEIKVSDIRNNKQSHSSIVYLIWKSEKIGVVSTKARLKFDDNDQIEEIDEECSMCDPAAWEDPSILGSDLNNW